MHTYSNPHTDELEIYYILPNGNCVIGGYDEEIQKFTMSQEFEFGSGELVAYYTEDGTRMKLS